MTRRRSTTRWKRNGSRRRQVEEKGGGDVDSEERRRSKDKRRGGVAAGTERAALPGAPAGAPSRPVRPRPPRSSVVLAEQALACRRPRRLPPALRDPPTRAPPPPRCESTAAPRGVLVHSATKSHLASSTGRPSVREADTASRGSFRPTTATTADGGSKVPWNRRTWPSWTTFRSGEVRSTIGVPPSPWVLSETLPLPALPPVRAGPVVAGGGAAGGSPFFFLSSRLRPSLFFLLRPRAMTWGSHFRWKQVRIPRHLPVARIWRGAGHRPGTH
jgi:hypothetical protein